MQDQTDRIGVDSWPKKLCTRAIQKVTSGEQLTKQAIRKKNTYKIDILKQLLKAVTTEIEDHILYACAKEICRLWVQSPFDTFHQTGQML
jgi:hypothetical protein